MTDALQQINITYSPEEDRLLLKASAGENQEFRIWLTRRYTSLLLHVLGGRMEEAGGMGNVAARQNTVRQLKEGALDAEYQPRTDARYPLGEAGVLGYSINSGETQDGSFAVHLLPQRGQGLNLNLDDSMLYLMHSLLDQAARRAEWNLDTMLPPTEALH